MQTSDPLDAEAAGPFASPHAGTLTATEVRIADEAARLLRGGAPGVLLCGPQAPALVPAALDALPVASVRFDAATGSVETLRARVQRTHAARSDASIPLLLVVDEADRLAGELLQELERAAAAAAEFGGLSFLFVARHEPADLLGHRELPALARCLEAALRCDDPGIVPDTGEWFRSLARTGGAAAPARRPRLLLAGGILALLAAVLAVGVARLGQRNPGRREVAVLAAPPALRTMPGAPLRPPPLPIAPEPGAGMRAGQEAGLLPAPPPGPAPGPPPGLPPRLPPGLPPPPPPPASASLLLIAGPGDTLASLYAQVYRGMTAPPPAQVAAANPTAIGVGTRLLFPAPAGGWAHARQAGTGGD